MIENLYYHDFNQKNLIRIDECNIFDKVFSLRCSISKRDMYEEVVFKVAEWPKRM